VVTRHVIRAGIIVACLANNSMRSHFIALCLVASSSYAQWVPDGVLGNIPKLNDPTHAGPDFAKGAYERGGKYVIYTCDSCLAAVDKAHPDASHFLIVRAYTYRAMNADGEEAGDVWAASAVTQAPNAVHYLNAALGYFAESKDPHMAVRHERIRAAAVQIAQLAGLTMKWNETDRRFEDR
jgi:hypothetical protein